MPLKGALRAAWKLAALKQSRPLFLRSRPSGIKRYGQWCPGPSPERAV